jgi:hypothetical protein
MRVNKTYIYLIKWNNLHLLVKWKISLFTVTIMTWVTVVEYLCHKWPRICSIRRKHFLVLSSFMTYHGFVTRFIRFTQAGTAYPSGVPEFTPDFSGIRVTGSESYVSVFKIVVCPLSFFFWSLRCLFFFDLRIMTTPLVSSNSSCIFRSCVIIFTS